MVIKINIFVLEENVIIILRFFNGKYLKVEGYKKYQIEKVFDMISECERNL